MKSRCRGKMITRRTRKPLALFRKRNVGVLFLLLAILLHPHQAHAYAGPGSGFAVLSSAWTLLLTFLYSVYAFVTWPFRQAFRLARRRKSYRNAKFKRVVVVGFDGMDPDLAERFMQQGKMPHFAKMRAQGTFRKLRTTFPPISPVAWSTFMTGVNPGKHNIYDFLARDLSNYLPYLSSAEIKGPKRSWKIGKYTIPLGGPRIRGMRRGTPFWHWLGEAGIFCSIIRVPVTFPPEKFPGVLLSGMCVPDLKGSQGTFCFHSTHNRATTRYESGVRFTFEKRGSVLQSYIPGPDHPLHEESRELRVEFTVRPDPIRGEAEIVIGTERFKLKLGEYSEWIPVKFTTGFGMGARGICRFNLRQLEPEVEVYVTPVNIDPQSPSLPIAHPNSYSIYLSKLFGRFSTLGLAEDTWGLNEEVLDDASFLQQCYDNHSDREEMFFDALEKTPQGLCACVFDTTDRVQHMFWRYMEDGNSAAPRDSKSEHAQVIEHLYQRVDGLVGRIMQQIDPRTLLLVISDHGFKSFNRGVNLNSWLLQNGYLVLHRDAIESGDWFQNVDWSSTRAYTLGLNGLYLNIARREGHRTVKPGAEAEELTQELSQKLEGLIDPETGRVSILGVFACGALYAGPYATNAPDLIVGYSEGHRASWDAVNGRVTLKVFEDNPKAWSGDHCIDPRLVPGVLFSNQKIEAQGAAIVDVAPTILNVFGIPKPHHMDGRVWKVNSTSIDSTAPNQVI